jgi:hypothetical protein
MPKYKVSDNSRLNSFVNQLGNDVFSTDGTVLFCKICEVKVAADKKFTVEQHISRIKHINGVELKKKNQQSASKFQRLITEPSKKSCFNEDLCRALLSANIPLHKLQNETFKTFLEKYTNKTILDESTLRKSYVFQCYQETIDKIRNYVENKKI